MPFRDTVPTSSRRYTVQGDLAFQLQADFLSGNVQNNGPEASLTFGASSHDPHPYTPFHGESL